MHFDKDCYAAAGRAAQSTPSSVCEPAAVPQGLGELFIVLAPLALALSIAGCNSQSKTVGLISPPDRARPLIPATRTALEAQGAECTPNEVGPVLCTWTGNGASCTLTFDQSDALTHLTCNVDTLTWECTRPGQLYVCSWSDDPGCADVYTLDGIFEAYLCGQALIDRIGGSSSPDAGPGGRDAATPPTDAGQQTSDGGTTSICHGLDEISCQQIGPPTCRVDYCGGCGGISVFDRCADANDLVRPCAPVVCPDCTTLDQAACEAEPSCHGVYFDPQACACAPAGCCTVFQRCEPNLADCTGLNLACRQAEPHCEGPYVPSYVDACYEGCALATECAPSPVMCTGSNPTFPTFNQSCTTTADCVAGVRQQNCCGTRVAIGINNSELGRFDRAAGICASQFPGCGCADQGIEVDDGTFVPNESNVGVSCNSMNRCETFAVP